MAASYTIYRNYDSTDTESTSMAGGLPQITDIDESSVDPVDWSRDNYDFLGWNDSRDGSGNMYQPGDTPAAYSLFAIWEEAAVVVPDVTISYNGNTIASLSDSGTEVLETDGKICEDDITITYTKPSGGGGSAYNGNVTYVPSDEHNVLIMLTNPSHPDEFQSCEVYEALSNDIYDNVGEQLGSIDTPSGYTSIKVSSEISWIKIIFDGSYVASGTSSCTGGVQFIDSDGEGTELYSVNGDGTITVDQVDYDD